MIFGDIDCKTMGRMQSLFSLRVELLDISTAATPIKSIADTVVPVSPDCDRYSFNLEVDTTAIRPTGIYLLRVQARYGDTKHPALAVASSEVDPFSLSKVRLCLLV